MSIIKYRDTENDKLRFLDAKGEIDYTDCGCKFIADTNHDEICVVKDIKRSITLVFIFESWKEVGSSARIKSGLVIRHFKMRALCFCPILNL